MSQACAHGHMYAMQRVIRPENAEDFGAAPINRSASTCRSERIRRRLGLDLALRGEVNRVFIKCDRNDSFIQMKPERNRVNRLGSKQARQGFRATWLHAIRYPEPGKAVDGAQLRQTHLMCGDTSAIDVDRLAGDVPRTVGAKEADQICNLFIRPGPTHRNTRL